MQLRVMRFKGEGKCGACAVMSNSLYPMDCSLPGSSVRGVFQARILEWVAISFSSDCENWTIKKAERRRIGAFELWCWRILESPLLQGDQSSKS